MSTRTIFLLPSRLGHKRSPAGVASAPLRVQSGVPADHQHKPLLIDDLADHVHLAFGMRPAQSLSELARYLPYAFTTRPDAAQCGADRGIPSMTGCASLAAGLGFRSAAPAATWPATRATKTAAARWFYSTPSVAPA